MKIEPFLLCRKDEGGVATLSSLPKMPEISYKDIYDIQKKLSFTNIEDFHIKTIIENINSDSKTIKRITFFYACVYKNEILKCGRNWREWIEGCFIDFPIEDSDIDKIRFFVQDYFKNEISKVINLSNSGPYDYRYLYSNYISGESYNSNLKTLSIDSLNESKTDEPYNLSPEKEDIINDENIRNIATNIVKEIIRANDFATKDHLKKIENDINKISSSNFLQEKDIELHVNQLVKKAFDNQDFTKINQIKIQTNINTALNIILCIIIILLIISQ